MPVEFHKVGDTTYFADLGSPPFGKSANSKRHIFGVGITGTAPDKVVSSVLLFGHTMPEDRQRDKQTHVAFIAGESLVAEPYATQPRIADFVNANHDMPNDLRTDLLNFSRDLPTRAVPAGSIVR